MRRCFEQPGAFVKVRRACYLTPMLSPELKAQASLAWHNWKSQLSGHHPSMSEEDFISMILNLQSQQYSGLLARGEFDARLNELLKNPSAAVQAFQFTPPQRSTDSLMRELESLHKARILNDEEYGERKSELLYQRNVSAPQELATTSLDPEERRKRLFGYLDTLKQEGILTQQEFESARARV